MIKKIAISVLIVAMLFSIVACSGGTTDASESASSATTEESAVESSTDTSESAAASTETGIYKDGEVIPDKDGDGVYTVGLNTWVQGNFALDTIQSTTEYSYESVGFECIAVNDEANVDKSVSNIQNLLSQGVDIIDYWAINESCALTVAEMCKEAETPFFIRDGFPTNEEVVEQIKANPYFIGYVGIDNYQSGAEMAEYVIEAGYTQGIVTGVDLGQAGQDARCNGFAETVEAAGITVLGTARPNSTSTEEIQQQCEDLLVANQDAEFWYSAFLDCVTAGQTTIDNLGMEMGIYISDINPTSLEAIKSGEYAVINGCQWIGATWAAGLVYNYMNGHRILDADGGAPIISELKMLTVTAETADIFNQYFLEEQPYSVEYIQDLCYDVNPEHATYDYYESQINSASLESILKIKESEGQVTAEELAAVGIE